jgi:hypothetical protein
MKIIEGFEVVIYPNVFYMFMFEDKKTFAFCINLN